MLELLLLPQLMVRRKKKRLPHLKGNRSPTTRPSPKRSLLTRKRTKKKNQRKNGLLGQSLSLKKTNPSLP
uniref:Unkown protein n=1 Tax=Riptortus pedestris TaxID=329032 RepID=R4WCT6_RIPPE|nr:unkown protein [Riptortus pedestris]